MKTIEERAVQYEEISGCYGCQLGQVKEAFIAGAKSEHEELTRWNNIEQPPEHSQGVLVKYENDDNPEIHIYGVRPFMFGRVHGHHAHILGFHPIGWREIHE